MSDRPHIIAVIPARYASVRFPGKMLADLNGLPLVVRTFQNTKRCTMIDDVLVATDDERIVAAIQAAGGDAILTDPALPSGTDRIHAAILGQPGDIVVNVQGDEPLLPPELVDDTVRMLLDHPEADASTAATPATERDYTDPNVVKVACAENGRALYFSRAPIPHQREGGVPDKLALRHIGLYVYRRETLNQFCMLTPSPLEACEKLEQLRLLEDGGTMVVHVTGDAGPGGVDTAEDLERVKSLM
ncbi:3-deoxy-manno-octulosonate cytidylyltransferase [bacterium]|nr:3-deoxy-manno-octulosonate cytidylyltransferase [bacterium]